MPDFSAILHRLLAQPCPHPLRVAIDGVDTAGKTTLANRLAKDLARISPRQIVQASIDGFHRPRCERYRLGPDSPEGYFLDSFDLSGLRRRLLDPAGQPASGNADRIVYTQCFDHISDAPHLSPPFVLHADAILLLDGIFLQRPELAGCWDCIVFIQVSFATVLERAIRRDAAHLGGTEAARERYRRRYIPAQQRYLSECRPDQQADIIVHNDDPEKPIVIVRPAQNKDQR